MTRLIRPRSLSWPGPGLSACLFAGSFERNTASSGNTYNVHIPHNHSTGGAARALDAPLGVSVQPGARAAAFLKLNPSIGDPAPPPPTPPAFRGPCQGGGDVPPREVLHPQPPAVPPVRRPFSVHWDSDSAPLVFTVEQIVAKARSLDNAKLC